MEATYHDAPEVVLAPPAPEVHHPPDGIQAVDVEPQLKPDDQLYVSQLYHQSLNASPYDTAFQYPPFVWPPTPQYEEKARWWRSPLIISLSMALLGIAAIGLAVGTGIAVNKYNNLHHQFETLSLSTSMSYLSNGCTDQRPNTTGRSYITKNNSDTKTYTVRCYMNVGTAPIYSLFANNFNGCMEACSIWNAYNLNQSCKSVTYIPAWTDIYNAWHQSWAPGNCYLKPDKTFDTSLPEMEIDAGILED